MTRVVLDANVLVSALLHFENAPSAVIYEAIKSNKLVLVTSKAILAEVQDVLSRDRIATKYQLSTQRQQALLSELKQVAYLVKVGMTLSAVEADPDDNKILACAMKGKAAFVVTGDHHLLDMRHYHHIQIVTPSEFLLSMRQPQQAS